MEGLGVSVGLEKSILQARGTCEFAKRFIFQKANCSPLSFAAYGIAQSSISVFDMLVRSSKAIFPELTLKAVLRSAGAGYKVLARLPALLDTKNRFAALVLFMTRPGGSFERPFFDWIFGTWDGVLSHTGRDRSRAVDWLLKDEFARLADTQCPPATLLSNYCAYDNLLENLMGSKSDDVQAWLRDGVSQEADALRMNLIDSVVRIGLDWRYLSNNPEGLLETLGELQLSLGQLFRLGQ